MFGIDAVDLLIILVLAVVMFGPERLPEYSRKAARVFVYLRDIANNAKSSLQTELGPEYAELELRDLHPKAFITKHMREEVALLDEAKREMQSAKQMLTDSTNEATSALKGKGNAGAVGAEDGDGPAGLDGAEIGGAELPGVEAFELAAVVSSPYDPEAT